MPIIEKLEDDFKITLEKIEIIEDFLKYYETEKIEIVEDFLKSYES